MHSREPQSFIILRRVPYGDTSLIVHLFSAARGRQSAIAKGAFREKSPMFGSLDLLNEIRATVGGKNAEALQTLTNAELVEPRRALRRDLRALTAALYSVELLESGLTESPAPALFLQFRAWLDWLESAAARDPLALRAKLLAFELQFLEHIGLRPVLDACACCGAGELAVERSGARRVFWDCAAGGVLCAACAGRARASTSFAATAHAAIADLQSGASANFPGQRDSRELRAFLDRFHAYHLDRALRSRPSLEILWRGDAA
ncbi:MAG: DNA repair protein RecO [Planctomycetes bacterium]|nr:DNA repair protein RecO [Planctomycetota bacterium]